MNFLILKMRIRPFIVLTVSLKIGSMWKGMVYQIQEIFEGGLRIHRDERMTLPTLDGTQKKQKDRINFNILRVMKEEMTMRIMTELVIADMIMIQDIQEMNQAIDEGIMLLLPDLLRTMILANIATDLEL
jgi:hypothetical protein